MIKYFTLLNIFIFFYSANTKADICDPQFWEDPSREEINSFLPQHELVSFKNSDVLFENCENGKKPIEIASETAPHAIIVHLLCIVAISTVFGETAPYLMDHFTNDHRGRFPLGVYITTDTPAFEGGEGELLEALTMQMEDGNTFKSVNHCHTSIYESFP